MVGTGMHRSSYALANGRHLGLSIDARVTCAAEWTSLSFGHGFAGHRMRSGMDVWLRHGYTVHRMRSGTDVIMVWAWIGWSSYALGNGRCYGLGMDGLVIVCA